MWPQSGALCWCANVTALSKWCSCHFHAQWPRFKTKWPAYCWLIAILRQQRQLCHRSTKTWCKSVMQDSTLCLVQQYWRCHNTRTCLPLLPDDLNDDSGSHQGCMTMNVQNSHIKFLTFYVHLDNKGMSGSYFNKKRHCLDFIYLNLL